MAKAEEGSGAAMTPAMKAPRQWENALRRLFSGCSSLALHSGWSTLLSQVGDNASLVEKQVVLDLDGAVAAEDQTILTTIPLRHITLQTRPSPAPTMELPMDGDLDFGLAPWEVPPQDGLLGAWVTTVIKQTVGAPTLPVEAEAEAEAVGTMEKEAQGRHRATATRARGMRVPDLARLLDDELLQSLAHSHRCPRMISPFTMSQPHMFADSLRDVSVHDAFTTKNKYRPYTKVATPPFSFAI